MNPPETPENTPLLLNEIYGNIERITSIFYWIITSMLAALVAGIFIVLSTKNVLAAEIIAVTIIPVSASFFLVRSRKFELTAAVLAILFITSITWTATYGEGIHNLSVLGYPVVLIIASLVIRKRTMIFLTLYSILCVAWLVFGELLGLYKPFAIIRSVPGDFFTASVIITLTAITVRVLTETLFQNSITLQRELKERKRIESAMQRRADEMTLLYQLNISLASGRDLQSTLLALQSEIERLIKADAFMVAFYDQETDVVSYPIFFERGQLVSPPDRILHEDPGFSGPIILNNQMLYLPDMSTPEVEQKFHPYHTGGDVLHTFLGIPLTVNGHVIGMMSVQSNEVDAYTPIQIQLIETIAVQAALAIDKARLLDQLQRELAEREQAEKALAISERKFYQAFHTTPVMMTLESNGIFTDVNQAFIDASGYSREEILGHHFTDITLLASDEDRRILDELNKNQKKVQGVELHFRRKSGEVGTALLSNDRFDVDGTVYELTSGLDITDRKLVEAEREKLIAELKAKNTELEQFTYVVSHDLRAPLITVKGFVGFLERDLASANQGRIHDDMKRINDATEKMELLMKELLELSRIGRMMNPPQKISFESLVNEALQNVRGRLDARGISVRTQPNLPAVYGDRQRLIEALQNLLDNSAKYMGDQPHPVIEIGQRGEEDGKLIFFVKDNGMGIAPAYHERIFGLFNKLDPQSEGTGIGLTLVKRIIEFHESRIWVESEEGKGATFFFTLPKKSALREI
ncbi:MAG TPA: ATP-binding protein [Anaerolineales bacterium]